MDEAEAGLYELVAERLLADGAVPDRVSDLVLAAWSGDDDLAAALVGTVAPSRAAPVGARVAAPAAYLAAVHVEGFRGVGAPATLPLRPGPGLVLVTGRNGSGKSSFAEAAELALTGDSLRWSGRAAVWREGWRNLHEGGRASVAVDLVTSGEPGTARVARTWAPGQDLLDGSWTRQRHGRPREAFDGESWRAEMETYRPFLSYSELGGLIDGRPSELHDALRNLLGLAPLGDAHKRLTAHRKRLTDAQRAVTADRKQLRAELGTVDDDRARSAARLLTASAPDLGAVGELVLGTDDDAADLAALRELAALAGPDPANTERAAQAVRTALDHVAELATADVRSADDTAALLRAALHQHHGDGPCPVCGVGRLDDTWRVAARTRLVELEAVAGALRDAGGRLDSAVEALRSLATPVPAVLTAAPVDVSAARAAWTALRAGVTAGPAELAQRIADASRPLATALDDLRTRAGAELARRDEVWAPLARRLAAWHDAAAAVRATAPQLAEVKAAEDWLAATATSLRDERLAPFAEASQRIWQQLRQQSNVDLGPVRLDGANTRRRVAMDVTVDGADGGTALGVMSQGELHALGLALFLPRATVPQSPFRFVVIDDPVQAMDPAKVDGLARVLGEVAADRQVVVFTHDDRLAEAVRRLEVPATVWEVHRRERSQVELRLGDDPVQRYLDDARAVALTAALPVDLRAELVASCCRSAVEAACHAKVRTVRLGRGEPHADVEAALSAAVTTHTKVALAVFDDPARGGDVLGRLKAAGPGLADALQAVKKGAHAGLHGDLRPVVRDASSLAAWILR